MRYIIILSRINTEHVILLILLNLWAAHTRASLTYVLLGCFRQTRCGTGPRIVTWAKTRSITTTWMSIPAVGPQAGAAAVKTATAVQAATTSTTRIEISSAIGADTSGNGTTWVRCSPTAGRIGSVGTCSSVYCRSAATGSSSGCSATSRAWTWVSASCTSASWPRIWSRTIRARSATCVRTCSRIASRRWVIRCRSCVSCIRSCSCIRNYPSRRSGVSRTAASIATGRSGRVVWTGSCVWLDSMSVASWTRNVRPRGIRAWRVDTASWRRAIVTTVWCTTTSSYGTETASRISSKVRGGWCWTISTVRHCCVCVSYKVWKNHTKYDFINSYHSPVYVIVFEWSI